MSDVNEVWQELTLSPGVRCSPPPVGRVAIVGSGESHAASLLAARYGWTPVRPDWMPLNRDALADWDSVVGVSWSGESRAVGEVLQLCTRDGVRSVLLTAADDCSVGGSVDQVVKLPAVSFDADLPFAAYASTCLGLERWLLRSGGVTYSPQPLSGLDRCSSKDLELLPRARPSGVTIVTDLQGRSAVEYGHLKLIESTGICVRVAGWDEVGHAEYFMSPGHLVLVAPVVRLPRSREAPLTALRRAGFLVQYLEAPSLGEDVLWRTIFLAARLHSLARHASQIWGQGPFLTRERPMFGEHVRLSWETGNE